MDGDYKYRPRFKDIRVKPPEDEAKPEDRVCEHPRCRAKATARAPQSRANRTRFYWFCQAHASDYNKGWNFFEGMSEGAAKAYMEADMYGHRPTWSFSTGAGACQAADNPRDRFVDPFDLFGDRPPPGQQRTGCKATDPMAGIGRLQKRALETLNLGADADKGTVHKRYAELVRLYHPDSNGGDRSMEDMLQKVVDAYQILKSAGRG